MKIIRALKETIKKRIIENPKIIIIYGARQTGKTTLSKEIIDELGYKTLLINAEERIYDDILTSRDSMKLNSLVSGYRCIFIDEAQRIKDIGINLKILHDSNPDLRIIVTGSSSFDLANLITEPLTGRHWTFSLFPISIEELRNIYADIEISRKLEDLLLFGSYPEIFSFEDNQLKESYLKQISTDYLYKDALELVDVRNSGKVRDLLKLIALQIGSNVSMNELSARLGISKVTVERYLDLLEKNFIIYRLTGFSRNLRKEITQQPKIYFNDLGIRNAIINDFKPLSNRLDVGALWENFLINERMKKNQYNQKLYTPYFWRTYTGSEVDYIEDSGGILSGFEFKYGSKVIKSQKSWLSEYKNSTWSLINQENFLEFVA